MGPPATLSDEVRNEAIDNPEGHEAQVRHRHGGERSGVE
jgi:hypothetical protein